MPYRIVIDSTTKRVIYWTNTDEALYYVSEDDMVVEYDGDLPEMEYPWNYVYSDGKFFYRPGKSLPTKNPDPLDRRKPVYNRAGIDKTNTWHLLELIITKERQSLNREHAADLERLVQSELFRLKYGYMIASIYDYKKIVKLHEWLVTQYEGTIDYDTVNRTE